jgi:hypothetical protein
VRWRRVAVGWGHGTVAAIGFSVAVVYSVGLAVAVRWAWRRGHADAGLRPGRGVSVAAAGQGPPGVGGQRM